LSSGIRYNVRMTQSGANIDPREIDKFDESASHWWDPHGEFKPLHDINPVRLGFIEQHAALASKRVADIGCGGGILAESMAAQGAEVIGIDMATGPLQVARLHLLESGRSVDYRQMTAEQLADQEEARFDIVTCMELLEHVPDPGLLIQSCARLAKPDAKLFFSTLNRNPKAYALAILGAEYVLRMLPRGTHDYRRFIRPSELEHWVRKAGLRMRDLKGMRYNPLTAKFSLSDDIDVNYLAYCTKE